MRRRGHMSKSPKARLMGRIRRAKAAAALLRLDGKIAGAMRYEEELDRFVHQAEMKGWADDAVDAEERGLHEAERAHRR